MYNMYNKHNLSFWQMGFLTRSKPNLQNSFDIVEESDFCGQQDGMPSSLLRTQGSRARVLQ